LILFREDYNVEGTSVSFGGRVMLINSILVAIPIYYLSFLKMSGNVWKTLRKIQRKFLRGWVKLESKICCVKWDEVCRPKCDRGLGVKDKS
jgi:hypothetical protein